MKICFLENIHKTHFTRIYSMRMRHKVCHPTVNIFISLFISVSLHHPLQDYFNGRLISEMDTSQTKNIEINGENVGQSCKQRRLNIIYRNKIDIDTICMGQGTSLLQLSREIPINERQNLSNHFFPKKKHFHISWRIDLWDQCKDSIELHDIRYARFNNSWIECYVNTYIKIMISKLISQWIS